MTALNKQALRKSAEKAQEHGVFNMDIHSETVLALLDELEAKDKSISFLKDQLAQLANFNPDWDKLEAATDSLREHMAELTAARKRIAELEAVTSEQRAEHDAGMKEFSAMLQGAEPVTTAYKLRDAVEIIRNSGIEIDSGKIQAERDSLNSPVIPDCSCRTCRPVTFSDSRFVVCPECGNKRCPHANDHRNACSGSNEPGQEGSAYPAAPQQEVK